MLPRTPARWKKSRPGCAAGRCRPPGCRDPTGPRTIAVAGSLEAALDLAAAAAPNPGRSVLHRLNRAEYTNAIRDLLALDVDGRSLLPADDSGYGFDNISDVLSVSPALLERYMIAAGKISRLAIGEPSTRPAIQTYSVRPTLLQHDRMSEDLPFATRGGLAVRHYFPVDGEYLIKIRLQRTHSNQIRGLGEPNEIEVRLDRQRVKQFTVGGDGPRDPWSAVPSASVYEQTADDGLEVRLNVKAGTGLIGVAFPKKSALPEGVLEPRLSVATYEFAGDRDAPMSVESIQISGPHREADDRRHAEPASHFHVLSRSPERRSDLREASPRERSPDAPTDVRSRTPTSPRFSASTTRGVQKEASRPASSWRSGRCWSIPTFSSDRCGRRRTRPPAAWRE